MVKYFDEIPASKTERLQPRFLSRESGLDNGTVGEIAKRNKPEGLKVKETSSGGAIYPDEAGRRGRIGLSKRFLKE